MNYFVWDVYFPGDKYAYCEEMKGIDDDNIVDLLSGTKLKNNPEFTAEKFSTGSIGDIFGCGGGIVVSEKIKAQIDGNNIQFLKVRIEPSNLKYYLANFLDIIDCIDEEKSAISFYGSDPKNIEKIKKLVLLPDIPSSTQVFRIDGRPDVVVVTEALKKQLQKASRSSGKFPPVEKFKIGYL